MISEVGSGATAIGSTTPASVTHGLTIASDDFIIAVINRNATGTGISDNNGSYPFTEVLNEDLPASGSSGRYAIFVRRAGASEPSSYSFNLGGDQNWSINLRVFRNVDASPWDVQPSTSTRTGSSTDGTTATAPAMSTTYTGSLGIVFVVTDGFVTYSNPTQSYTAELENGSGQGSASYTKALTGTGSQPAVDVTLAATNDWTAHQFALKAALTASTITVPGYYM